MTIVALALCLVSPMPSSQSVVMPDLIAQFQADYGSLSRKYPIEMSTVRDDRLQNFYAKEREKFANLRVSGLDDTLDQVLMVEYLDHEMIEIRLEREKLNDIAPLLPFSKDLAELELKRRQMDALDPAATANTLNKLAKDVIDAQEDIDSILRDGEKSTRANVPDALKILLKNPKDHRTRVRANRAAMRLDQLRRHLDNWYSYFNGYDPMFTWWCEAPYKALTDRLAGYSTMLRERLVGIRPDDRTTIIGDPIGREALMSQLQRARIPYSPEELIQIADKEFAWCEAELKKAAKDLGFDNPMEAIEFVKTKHVQPGEQPKVIRDMAVEAIDFVESRNLVTVPPLAKETWRMEMLSPQAQLQSPFFLGGEMIQVSFPTSGMSHESKLMSLRGNNIHFSRAVVHHELIPGHHLQGFMIDRHRPHRQMFNTPFWVEGWALYWEMLLWDLGFAKTPEQRVGMLFWRMHRCARIQFSLGFHLGKLTPEECVKILVEKVGHEPDNAYAEVRRSFGGVYGPLYQIAYMVGGLQFRALHKELVQSKKMSNQQFHDAILKNGPIPVELVRAALTGQVPEVGKSSWRFYAL